MSGELAFGVPGRCRVCLEHQDYILSLDNVVKVQDEEVSLTHILVSCCDVEIVDGDKKPQSVCTKCAQDAENSYKFKRTVEKADLTLQNEIDNLDMMQVDVKEELEDISFEERSYNELANDQSDDDFIDPQSDSSEHIKIGKNNETDAPTHFKKQHAQTTAICDICGRVLKHKKYLAKHKEIHKFDVAVDPNAPGTVKERTCIDCGAVLRYKEYMVKHKSYHEKFRNIYHNDVLKKQTCDYCGIILGITHSIHTHKITRHPQQYATTLKAEKDVGERTCDECGFLLKYKHCMRKHKEDHKRLNKSGSLHDVSTCEECGAILSSRSIARHKRNQHTNSPSKASKRVLYIHSGAVEDRMCRLCGVVLKFQHFMPRHAEEHKRLSGVQSTGGALDKKTCEDCGVIFSKASAMIKHKKAVHKYNVEEHTCDECGVVLVHAEHMDVHMEQHRARSSQSVVAVLKEQTCEECGMIFNTKKYVREHKRIMNRRESMKVGSFQERTCDECGRIFINKFVLLEHKKLEHSGDYLDGGYGGEDEVERTCDVCGIVLKFKEHMRVHKEEHDIEERNKAAEIEGTVNKDLDDAIECTTENLVNEDTVEPFRCKVEMNYENDMVTIVEHTNKDIENIAEHTGEYTIDPFRVKVELNTESDMVAIDEDKVERTIEDVVNHTDGDIDDQTDDNTVAPHTGKVEKNYDNYMVSNTVECNGENIVKLINEYTIQPFRGCGTVDRNSENSVELTGEYTIEPSRIKVELNNESDMMSTCEDTVERAIEDVVSRTDKYTIEPFRGKDEMNVGNFMMSNTDGIVEHTSDGIVECNSNGIVECTSDGIVERTSDGIVERTSDGIVEHTSEYTNEPFRGNVELNDGDMVRTYDDTIEHTIEDIVHRTNEYTATVFKGEIEMNVENYLLSTRDHKDDRTIEETGERMDVCTTKPVRNAIQLDNKSETVERTIEAVVEGTDEYRVERFRGKVEFYYENNMDTIDNTVECSIGDLAERTDEYVVEPFSSKVELNYESDLEENSVSDMEFQSTFHTKIEPTIEDTAIVSVKLEDLMELAICAECGIVLKHKQYMIKHKNEHKRLYRLGVAHNEALKKHTCEDCGRIFFNTANMERHKQSVHKHDENESPIIGTQENTCDECGVVLKHSEHMIVHKKQHRVPRKSVALHDMKALKEQTCDDCGSIFSTRKILANHKREMKIRAGIIKTPVLASKNTTKERTCDECGRIFMNKSAVIIHKETEHVVEGQIITFDDENERTCDECGVVLKSKHLMIAHKEDHTTEKLSDEERTCGECGVVLKYKEDMAKHTQDHTKMNTLGFTQEILNKYTCKECGTIFSYERNLERHKRKVHRCDIKKATKATPENTCDECGIVLKHAEHMTIHKEHHRQRSQSGDPQDMKDLKERTCDECGFILNRKKSVSEHKRKDIERRKILATPLEQFGGTAKERTCLECGHILANKRLIVIHKQTQHPDVKSENPTVGDNNKITCNECSVVLKSTQHMLAHKEDHTQEKAFELKRQRITTITKCYKPTSDTYECNKCSFQTESRITLEQHLTNHPETSTIQTTIDFISKFNFHSHRFYDENTLNYKCSHCPYKDESLDYFEIHYQSHLQPFICIFCGDSFEAITELIVHKNAMHSDLKTFACTICPHRFFVRTALRAHVLLHTNNKNHICEICGHAFAQLGNLRHHMAVHMDKSVRPFKCDECGNAFASQVSLGQHKRSHARPRAKCDECGKTYYSQNGLLAHQRRHRAEKKHKCKFCEKAFVTTGERNSHMDYHKGLKQHKCEICKKDFFTRNGLKTHQSVHTGEKPHVCEVCGRAFRLPVSLRTHMAKHHHS